MMTRFFKLTPILAILFASCEKVIEVDLNDADPQTVVDAALCSSDDTQTMFLTRSGSYTTGEGLGPITGAGVTISDENGQTASFTEAVEGLYELSGFGFVAGDNYTLNVIHNDQTIEATSTLPQLVEIDSVYFEEGSFGAPTEESEEEQYQVHIQYRDPGNEQNYYRAVVYVGTDPRSITEVANDDLNNGNEADLMFFDGTVEAGDTLSFELWSIDKAGYDFYNTLSASAGGPFGSSTPANPVSNLSSGLGHFMVYQKDTLSMIFNP